MVSWPLTAIDIVAIAVMLLLIRLARHAGMWIYALVALPGTALHEFSHFLVALLLGGSPSFPSLVPVRTEARTWHLGHVRFQPGFVRSMFVGMAPLLLAPLAWWWATTLLTHSAWPIYALHAWIVAAQVQAFGPSKTDWKLALPALAVLVPLALVLAWYFRDRLGLPLP
jgi:hypothetical protein